MAKQTEAAKKEADRKKQIREKNKSSVISFFNNYIAGRKTKIKTKNKENAKTRVENKTKTMADKYKSQMSKIAKNEKSVKSSQTDAQKSIKSRKDAVAQLMKKVNTPKPKAPDTKNIKKTSRGNIVKKTPKTPIVTKAQLAKSGLSLRDYMNFMQGKTRRDYKDVKMAAIKKRAKRSIT